MIFQEQIYFLIVAWAGFWLLIYYLNKIIHLEKYGFTVDVLFIRYDSKRFAAFLRKVSQKNSALWRTLSRLSIAIGAGLAMFGIFFFSDNLLKFILSLFPVGSGGGAAGGGGTPVVPVIPGLTLQLYWLPYVILAIVVAAVTHEIAHGIVALVDRVSVKSAGAFFLAIFPGGQVELNEEELQKCPTVSKLGIISAGSSMNILCGLLVFLVFSSVFVQVPSGIVIIDLSRGGPLEQAGFRRWDVISAVNGTSTPTLQELRILMSEVTPGDRLILSSNKGDVLITAASDPENFTRAVIGIMSPTLVYFPSRLGLGSSIDIQIYLISNWMFTILVSLAVFNMLPIPFLDGDRYFQYLLEKFLKKPKFTKILLNGFSLFLIIANMTFSIGSGLFPF